MKLRFILTALLCSVATSSMAAPELTVTSEAIKDGVIDAENCMCIPANGNAPMGLTHVKPGPNKSIPLSWSKGPEGTKSYAVLAYTIDAPVDKESIGFEGRSVMLNPLRKTFYLWAVTDIPANVTSITENASKLKTVPGKEGINDFTGNNPIDLRDRTDHYGYDGPCPPPSDDRVHNYLFKVYALDTESLGLLGKFTGAEVRKAVDKHTLASGDIRGTFSVNPEHVK